MGLTLPVVLEDRVLARADFRRALGLLYGFNTLGAVAGALIGELFLIKAFGLWGTSLAAGLLNCVAAAIALLLVKKDGATGTLTASPRARPRWLRLDYRLPWRPLFISFGAGCILLTLEVVWFRFLRLYVASSATAFSLMLAIVLAGIGLGGAASGAFSKKIARQQTLLPILLVVAAILKMLCYIAFPVPTLGEGEKNFYLDSWPQIALISLALMFPVAFLSGILFPAIAARVQESVPSRMNSLGRGSGR